MQASVDDLLKVRANPRPDPLHMAEGPLLHRVMPAAGAAVAATAAYFALDPRDLGLLACGAAVWSIGSCAARQSWSDVGQRLHLTAGLLALAVLRSAADAGDFVPATALLVVAALAAKGSAFGLRRSLSRMAGSVPWQFRSQYRSSAIRYGALGLGVGLVLVLFIPNPILKVIGVACVPLALRTFALQLLTPRKTRLLWSVVALFHVAAVIAFVPSHGAMAAAWIVVASESMLLAGAATLIAKRTGVSPFPTRTLAVGAGTALLICAAAVPGTGIWPFLVTVVFAAISSILIWPQKHG